MTVLSFDGSDEAPKLWIFSRSYSIFSFHALWPKKDKTCLVFNSTLVWRLKRRLEHRVHPPLIRLRLIPCMEVCGPIPDARQSGSCPPEWQTFMWRWYY